MKAFNLCILSSAVLLAASGAQAASRDDLSVHLSSASPVLQGDVDVVVKVAISNPTRELISVPRWELPSSEHTAALFRITREGQAVAYNGKLVKRAKASAKDMVQIAPGATLNYEVELTRAYQIERNGNYSIEFVRKDSERAEAKASNKQPSQALNLWLEGRSAPAADEALEASTVQEAQATVRAKSRLSYANCSASQQSTLKEAMVAARNLARNSSNYLSAAPSDSKQRFKKWFGPTSGWSTAAKNFDAIKDKLVNKTITLDCACDMSDSDSVFAYVYANDPSRMYFCGQFWAAKLTGTDSRSGTIIHEASHYDAVAGTDDHVYGQTGAANLAISDPSKALNNADNHEYFAENTPALD